jgi:hypothetical protein
MGKDKTMGVRPVRVRSVRPLPGLATIDASPYSAAVEDAKGHDSGSGEEALM